MQKTKGYAAAAAKAPLGPFAFERRDVGEGDVAIEIKYCGVCHSDIHQVRDEWGGSAYPMVPGHEIVGRVARVGSQVRGFGEGDLAGVGPLLCAGITTYSPLRHWKVGRGSRVAIVGLGGLGHMGVKFARAFG